MMKWWEYIDLLSVEAKLYIQGKNRYITRFGILFSIFSVITVLTLSLYFFAVFLQKTELNVIYFEQQNLFNPYINLTNSPFSYILLDQTLNPVDPSYVELQAGLILTSFQGARRINLETQPCKTMSNFENFSDQASIGNFNCIKENKYNLNLTYDPINYMGNYINLYTMKCVNSTTKNYVCKSPQEIDNYLTRSQMYIRYYLPIFSINHYNVTDPILKGWAVSQDAVITNLFYNRKILFKLTNYTTDYGAVLQEKETVSAYGIDPIRSKIEILGKTPSTINPSTIGMHSFQPITNAFDNYSRSYMKFQTILAYIGGVLKFVFFVAQIISRYITWQMLSVELSNFFVDFKDEKYFDGSRISNKLSQSNINNNHDLHNSTEMKKNSCILGNVLPNANTSIGIGMGNSNIINTSVNNYLNMTKVEKIVDITPNKRRWRGNSTTLKRLNFTEALLPRCCYKKKPGSMKHIVDDCDTVIKSKLSSDFMLKIFSDFEMIKNILLNDEQRLIFDNLNYPSLDAHLEDLRFTLKNIIAPEKLDDMVRNLENLNQEDKLNNRLLNLLK